MTRGVLPGRATARPGNASERLAPDEPVRCVRIPRLPMPAQLRLLVLPPMAKTNERKNEMITERFYGPDEPLPTPPPTELLRTAMRSIHQQPAAGLMAIELAITHNICVEVEALTRGDNDTKTQAWHRAAIATRAILRDHGESAKSEFLESYADLPPMEWPGSD